jgi:hypothetical protein
LRPADVTQLRVEPRAAPAPPPRVLFELVEPKSAVTTAGPATRSIASGRPTTPVDATSACPPHAARASAAIWRASRMPFDPVHALALPLLTTTPRIRPRVRARIVRDSSTGAAAT